MSLASPAILAIEYRGGIADNIHRGHLAVVDRAGRIALSVGDPEAIVFYRSASKPVQALPTLALELDKKYGITEEESVVFAASHAGERCHMAALESIFAKAGLREDDLIMHEAAPAHRRADAARLDAGLPKRKLYHNCAGKHAALMLLQRHLGGDVRDYWRMGSAADVAVRRAMEIMGGGPIAATGLDGCGVPVFAATVVHIATAFRNLARPEGIADADLQRAAEAFVPRINRSPVLMRGTDFVCGHINENPNIIAKGGAAGVYGLGLKAQGLGLGFKVESGSEDAWPCILRAVLGRLGALTDETEQMLIRLGAAERRNDAGEVAVRWEAPPLSF